MEFTLNQKTSSKGNGWWSWDVWLDGPDSDLDQIECVDYTLHPTFKDPQRRVTDRTSRFALHSGGWGEFMIYAEVRLRTGDRLPLRHWLRFQSSTAGTGRALFLTGAKENEVFTDALQERLEKSGLTVYRPGGASDDLTASLRKSSAAAVILSAADSPWFDRELESIRSFRIPLLVVTLAEVQSPPCLASFRSCDLIDPSTAVAWLEDVLDTSALPFPAPNLPTAPGAFWNKRLALAAMDLQNAARSLYPLVTADGAQIAIAAAIAPNFVVAALKDEPPSSLFLSLSSGTVPVSLVGPPKGVGVFQVATALPAWLQLAEADPSDPAVASISIDQDRKLSLRLGWLTGGQPPSPPDETASGAAIVSLENGTLFALNLPGAATIPASLIRSLLPPSALAVAPGALESAVEEDYLEKVTPEDYSDRKGYLPNFLGLPVPLPKTSKPIQLLPYENFSVALHAPRKVALFTAVNISGRQIVVTTRTTDPWKLDPRAPVDDQIGKHYYEGTPLDRGHMVRRLDPVWGTTSKKAELDTFHYPNSCPQHKNLNRKTWNDLEDYIYDNLQRDDMKVTVFTGPVLSPDDPVFHGIPLPQEFWKVVVIKGDDGSLSATAYLLSQEDMIKGLEFVYGEFRTYQVTVKLIEKKTGLDFGALREHDPKAKTAGLESAQVMELRSPADLDLKVMKIAPATPGAPAAAPPPPPPESAWQDPAAGELKLKNALATFDWTTSEDLVRGLIVRLDRDSAWIEEAQARRLLANLRRKRRFAAMVRLSDAFLRAGLKTHQIRRQYAQSLIDQEVFGAAELVLREILGDSAAPPSEQDEAQGLLGRIFKQIYVNAAAPQNPRNQAYLQSARNAYALTYALNPAQYWHGINVVAILARADRDKLTLKSDLDYRQVATDILKTLSDLESKSETGELPAFAIATRIEAYVALGAYDEAVAAAKAYDQASDADAFEIASTLRQMEQVWQLQETSAPGDRLLPVLRAALLRRQGGTLALSMQAAGFRLEKVFGSDRSVSLEWYQQGLTRARSVARIEIDGKGFGTGWLFDLADLVPGKPKRPILVTNAHVIGPNTPDRYPGSLRPEDATVHFEIQKFAIKGPKVIFHSPVQALDATFLELPQWPADTDPLPLDCSQVHVETPAQRLYIIGHPGGRDIEFSLQDNQLLAANTKLVHYRTPSEGGSSGSPVFGPVGWKVVALHHAGRKDMPRIDGQPGIYEANEGIALEALSLGAAAGPISG